MGTGGGERLTNLSHAWTSSVSLSTDRDVCNTHIASGRLPMPSLWDTDYFNPANPGQIIQSYEVQRSIQGVLLCDVKRQQVPPTELQMKNYLSNTFHKHMHGLMLNEYLGGSRHAVNATIRNVFLSLDFTNINLLSVVLSIRPQPMQRSQVLQHRSRRFRK